MDNQEKLAKIEKLRRDSKTRIEDLARSGVGDFGLGNMRLELLIEHLLPWSEDNDARLDMEVDWEERANEALRNAQEQIARMKLTQGISLVPNQSSNGHGG